MTAQEPATSLELRALEQIVLDSGELCKQQAEQIEQLGRWKSTHAPRIEALEGLLATTQRQVSTSREAAQMLESERQANAILTDENDALKADAERYRKLKSSEGPVYAYAKDGPDDHGWFPTFGGDLDAAIDAMKGQE